MENMCTVGIMSCLLEEWETVESRNQKFSVFHTHISLSCKGMSLRRDRAHFLENMNVCKTIITWF